MERLGPPQPPLSASASFFDGDVLVELSLVSVMAIRGGDSSKERGGRPSSDSDGHSGMTMGLGGEAAGGGGSVGGREGRGRGGDQPLDPPVDSQEAAERGGSTGFMVPMPRQALHASFLNVGKATSEIEVLDVNSLLGNFAARPERLSLAPNQRSEIDPMQSIYPDSLDALEVEVRLRRGKTVQKQAIHLVRTDGLIVKRP